MTLLIISLSNQKQSEQNFYSFPWPYLQTCYHGWTSCAPNRSPSPHWYSGAHCFLSTQEYPMAIGHLSFFTGLFPEAHKHPLPSPTGRWKSWTHITLQLPPYFTFFAFTIKCLKNIVYICCFHILLSILFWTLSTQAFLLPTLQKQLLSRSTVMTTCQVSGQFLVFILKPVNSVW